MAFMATILGCSSCNSCNNRFLNNGGMITRIPHKTHPWSAVSSFRRVKYGFSSSSVTWLSFPTRVYSKTLADTVSLRVCLLLSLESTANSSRPEKKKISASSFMRLISQGKRDKASALACSADERYSTWQLYACRITAQRCILAAAKVGTAIWGPKMVANGLWSINRWKGRPYWYFWNFRTPNTIPFLLYLRVVPFALFECFEAMQWDTLQHHPLHVKSRLSHHKERRCIATDMIPTIEMISAIEMTPNHHRNDPHHQNDTYSQSKWSRHKFLEPWLKWTWDFAIYSKFFVYSCKQDSKQRKIDKAIRLITVLYTDFIFKILTFF